MVRTRILLFLMSLILVPTATYFVILFARGYRIGTDRNQIITPTGLLFATSNPEGAQIYINDELKSATNTTFNLTPGKYSVQIKKDGFYPWTKQLDVQAEIVTRASAVLFPTVPSLRALTYSGALNPHVSPDGSKVAYVIGGPKQSKVYILDLSESPLGQINRDSRLVSTLANVDLSRTPFTWSPDSKQILASATQSAYLIDLNSQQSPTPIANTDELLISWKQLQKTRDAQKFATLPTLLQPLLASSAANLVWSPNENKIMYTATASATLPDELKKPLPGSNSQPQARILTPGHIYVYDLEEDRNFEVGSLPLPTPTPTPTRKPKTKNSLPTDQLPTDNLTAPLKWFSDSAHLIRLEGNQITIFEYDSQNPTIVYAGPMENAFVAPYPSGKNLVILTNLNPTNSSLPNLYALSLK